MIIAKVLLLLRAAFASGLGLKKILLFILEFGPLISAVAKVFQKEKPPVEGLEEEFHHAAETGDTSSLEETVREHRRKHRGGRLPKRRSRS